MKLNSDEVKEKQKNLSSKKKKKKTSLAVRIIRWILLTILSIICIGACLVLGMVVGIAKSTQALEEIQVAPTQYPTTILDANGNEILKLSAASAKRIEASLDEIPETLKWAFIDLEDERFYQHHGIDLKGIARAAYQTIKEGDTQGASTITQQLLKNNVFETGGFERSKGSLIRRKIQEQILALGLEKQMSKDEILINYLNTINLGGGNYGVKMAAKYYFNKDVSQLSVAECACIAAITQNPSGNNPARYPENNRRRMEVALNYMLKNGHITQSQYDEAMAEDVYAGVTENAASNGNPLYSYFIDSLVDSLINDLQKKAGYSYARAYNMVYTGGLTVYATQDPAIQAIVDYEVNNPDNYPGYDTYGISWDLTIKRADGSNEYFNQRSIVRWMEDVVQNYNFYDGTLEAWTYKNNYYSHEEADEVIRQFKEYISQPGDEITYESLFYTLQPQVSFTIMDYTNGHVLAICGGRGEKTQNLTLNRAVDTTRQPGSCFKVLAAYAPAIDAAGYTLGTAIDDSPFHYGGNINRDVHNWWGDAYRGLSTVREGIRDSMNVLAVKTLYDIGEDLSIQYLLNFGFTTIDPVMDAGVATALGGITNGITNLEITAAYGTIANKGVYTEPIMYTKIVAMDGTVVLDNTPETHTVLKESTSSLLTSAMIDVVNGGTGSAGAIWNAPVAGKTGTTSDDKDLWFCAFIPNGLVASVWTGYDENVSIVWGGVYHEYLWATIMSQVVELTGKEGGWFEMTGGIVQATICKKSGKIPNGACGGDAGCVITEYFAEGTVPGASCDVHTTCRVCEETKKLPTEYCPKVVDMVCRVRPLDVTGSEPKGETEDSKLAPPTERCTKHTAEWQSKSIEESIKQKEEEESRRREEEESRKKEEQEASDHEDDDEEP